ncbi:hypothetical protein [Nocardioides cynanchi]|uniref:hypothetical protein n=1 Tax=Nocardioides cynanchi TaxID=2558918 RepID=UPI001247B501|nr:hypothetical protein [Nocardioides cynanchi]
MSEPSAQTASDSYRQTLSELADLVGDEGHTANARRRDRLVEQLQQQRLALQHSPEGLAAIAALLDDPRPAVRLWSAGHSLFSDEARARSTLVELRDSPGRYGLHSIIAKHTLLEYDAGRLAEDARLPGT